MIKPPTVMPPAFDNARHGAIQMVVNEPELDDIVMASDAVSLLAYGAIQGFVDTLLSPMAAASRDYSQTTFRWTRPFRRRASLRCSGSWPLACLVVAMTAVLAAARHCLQLCLHVWCLGVAPVSSSSAHSPCYRRSVALGLAPAGEIDFVMGSITVVGAWRVLCSMYLPPI